MRTLVGTIAKLVGGHDFAAIKIKKENGDFTNFLCKRGVVDKLVEKYGVPDAAGGYDVSGVIGLRVQVDEDDTGMLTSVEAIPD